MAGCVQILAGVVASLALLMAVLVASEFVRVDDAVVIGLEMIGLVTFMIPALFSLMGLTCGWSLLPLLCWLFRTARRPWAGLLVALASSSAVLVWLVRSAQQGSRSLYSGGWGSEGATRPAEIPLIENLAFDPAFFTGWYLMPLVCWLWLPLRFESVWWRLPLFASAGAVIGCLLGPGGALSDQGWAIVASHAAYVAGLMWCRLFHRRSADFAHPSRGAPLPRTVNL